ncbi:hypothetical protein BMW22_10685 [Rhizobium leguminosarum]|uniref:Uncharacterized protein n=1 Tax=Rhizobium leguminosarum TaxID=384 RepID=A0A1L3Z8W6_RHILE|nr:hypothetical protein BMW22_10685 [Rhizobium leguminosarum]
MKDLLSETDVTWLVPLNFEPRRLFPSGFYLGWCAQDGSVSSAGRLLPCGFSRNPHDLVRDLLQSRGSF